MKALFVSALFVSTAWTPALAVMKGEATVQAGTLSTRTSESSSSEMWAPSQRYLESLGFTTNASEPLSIAEAQPYEPQLTSTRDDHVDVFSSTAICGGKTTVDMWKTIDDGHHDTVMYVDVNTSACNLPSGWSSYPYVTALNGDGFHWVASGTSSVYLPTRTSFRVFIDRSFAGMSFAQALSKNWHMTWAIDTTGTKSGCSPATWNDVSNGIYRDTSTASAGYTFTPRYVTSVHGEGLPLAAARGTHMIFNPTSTGFRTYLHTTIDKSAAAGYGWSVCWIGITDDLISGKSPDGMWKDYTSSYGWNAFIETPVHAPESDGYELIYITSMEGTKSHWMAYGAGSIYRIGDNLQTYIHGQQAAFWNSHGHRVNWIAAYMPLPTPTPTPSPTPPPTPSPPLASASAYDDPHLTNMRGESFDVWQLGHIQLLRVPFDATRVNTELVLDAVILNTSSDWRSKACLSSYITQGLISGRSIPQPVDVSVGHPGRVEVRINGSIVNFDSKVMQLGEVYGEPIILQQPSTAKTAARTVFEPRNAAEFVVGDATIQISAGKSHLNIFADGLLSFKHHVGGLLGEDNQTEAATAPAACVTKDKKARVFTNLPRGMSSLYGSASYAP